MQSGPHRLGADLNDDAIGLASSAGGAQAEAAVADNTSVNPWPTHKSMTPTTAGATPSLAAATRRSSAGLFWTQQRTTLLYPTTATPRPQLVASTPMPVTSTSTMPSTKSSPPTSKLRGPPKPHLVDQLAADDDALMEAAEEDRNPDDISDGLGELGEIAPDLADDATVQELRAPMAGNQADAAPQPQARAPSGPASSSTAPNAAVAPPLPARPAGDVLYMMEGGSRIIWFAKSRTFEASCSNTAQHGRCRLTRTSQPAKGNQLLSNPFQGRPLAMLLAWCQECDQERRAEHLAFTPSFESRVAARNRIVS